MNDSHGEYNNLYAENAKGQEVFIEEVESGRKGYFCIGCKKQMQAMKAHIMGRKSFFRHDPQFVTAGGTKCTYSDETYRHKLAKNILLREKSVRVPIVYKWPPAGVTGLAIKLRDAEVITANSVLQEVYFFEDELGQVKFGSEKVEEKHLLIKPDIVFFDTDNNPILLIELVATHGIDDIKKVKLRRLGIDAIQIKIPKSSPAAIEEAVHTTDKIKWIYNAEEARTNYESVSTGLSEGVLPADEQQRRFFTETFKCRQSQIKNFIRRLGAFMESEQYREVVLGLTEEIGRVEANAEREKSELEGIRAEVRKRVEKRLEQESKLLDKRRKSFEAAENEFREYRADLEHRYQSKNAKVRREQSAINDELRSPGEGIGRRRNELARQGDFIERETRRVEGEIAAREAKLVEIEREEAGLESAERATEAAIRRKFETDARNLEIEIRRIEAEEEGLPAEFGGKEESLRREFEQKERGITAEFERGRKDLEARFEELREQTRVRVVSRNGQGDYELTRRINGLLAARAALNDYWEVKRTFDRVRAAHEYYKSGAHQRRLV